MSIEHRANPSPDDVMIELRAQGDGVALTVAPKQGDDGVSTDERTPSNRTRVLDALHGLTRPVRVRQLRAQCRMRTKTLCGLLEVLRTEGMVVHSELGWRITSTLTGDPDDTLPSSDEQAVFPFPASYRE